MRRGVKIFRFLVILVGKEEKRERERNSKETEREIERQLFSCF